MVNNDIDITIDLNKKSITCQGVGWSTAIEISAGEIVIRNGNINSINSSSGISYGIVNQAKLELQDVTITVESDNKNAYGLWTEEEGETTIDGGEISATNGKFIVAGVRVSDSANIVIKDAIISAQGAGEVVYGIYIEEQGTLTLPLLLPYFGNGSK